MISYTPGPWKLGMQAASGKNIETEDRELIAAAFHCDLPPEEAKANARLIAAAPDLLETLAEIVGWLEEEDITSITQSPFCDLLVYAGRIIHAAKGEEDKE